MKIEESVEEKKILKTKFKKIKQSTQLCFFIIQNNVVSVKFC